MVERAVGRLGRGAVAGAVRLRSEFHRPYAAGDERRDDLPADGTCRLCVLALLPNVVNAERGSLRDRDLSRARGEVHGGSSLADVDGDDAVERRRLGGRGDRSKSAAGSAALRQLLVLIFGSVAAVWITIWAAYGFDYRATRKPQPVEQTVDAWYEKKARREERKGPPSVGALGRAVVIANRLHVLPEAYLYGFALVQIPRCSAARTCAETSTASDIARTFSWSFLVKTPIPTMIAIAAGIAVAFRRRATDAAVLLVPVLIYLAVSISSGLNIGHRHILPICRFSS